MKNKEKEEKVIEYTGKDGEKYYQCKKCGAISNSEGLKAGNCCKN